MSRNKSASHRKARQKRLAKKYEPKHKTHINSSLEENVMGNVDYDLMGSLSRDYGVSQGKLFCGYLRQPINYSGSDRMISGNCALDDRDCRYAIPCEGMPCSCQVYQDFFGIAYEPPAEKPSPLEHKLG